MSRSAAETSAHEVEIVPTVVSGGEGGKSRRGRKKKESSDVRNCLGEVFNIRRPTPMVAMGRGLVLAAEVEEEEDDQRRRKERIGPSFLGSLNARAIVSSTR
jgi:NAD(P)H-flavin reductase